MPPLSSIHLRPATFAAPRDAGEKPAWNGTFWPTVISASSLSLVSRCGVESTFTSELDWSAWRVPPIFDLLQEAGGLPFEEMWRVFNLGLGMVFVADDLRDVCPSAIEVGRVVPRDASRERVMLRR